MPASTRAPGCQPDWAEPHRKHQPGHPPAPSRDEFLSAVRRSVHDLNNLLTAMACHCDLLQTAIGGREGSSLGGLRDLVQQATVEVRQLSQSCARENTAK